jgi:hypothetical protein
MCSIPVSHDGTLENTDSRYACIALVQDTSQRAASTTALDGHVRHGVEGSACGRRTTQRIMYTMRLDETGPLCSKGMCASANDFPLQTHYKF